MSLTARTIIQSALIALNRLSPGEAADADLVATSLILLNNIVDEMNGLGSMLFREILVASAAGISAVTGTLGTTWTTVNPGDNILGATFAIGNIDYTMSPITMQQYHEQTYQKTLSTLPSLYAYDGLATVYFFPVPTGQVITLRIRQDISDFPDIDTVVSMPSGYRSSLADMLAFKLAPIMIGNIPPAIARGNAQARLRLLTRSVNPAIIGSAITSSSVVRIKRGY